MQPLSATKGAFAYGFPTPDCVFHAGRLCRRLADRKISAAAGISLPAGHRAALAVLWLLLYTAAVALFFPLSVPVMLLLNFWLPVQAALQAFYPVLDKTFDLEKTIKAMRDADLNQPDGDDR